MPIFGNILQDYKNYVILSGYGPDTGDEAVIINTLLNRMHDAILATGISLIAEGVSIIVTLAFSRVLFPFVIIFTISTIICCLRWRRFSKLIEI